MDEKNNYPTKNMSRDEFNSFLDLLLEELQKIALPFHTWEGGESKEMIEAKLRNFFRASLKQLGG